MATTKKATKKNPARKSAPVASKSTASKKAPTKKSVVARQPSTAAKKPYPENTPDNTRPPKIRPADAVDLLADDHLAVDKLFRQYERLATKNGPATERQALAEKICGMLKVHTRIGKRSSIRQRDRPASSPT